MISCNFNAPWHPLRSCWVGSTYSPDFYEPIKNSRIRDSLQKIAQETEEDYQNLTQVLQQHGVSVQRPEIATGTIMDYVNHDTGRLDYSSSKSFTLIPRPPMQPRDSILVVGDELLITQPEGDWFYPTAEKTSMHFDAPMVTVVGQHLVVDCRDNPGLDQYLQQRFPDRTIVPVMIGGHNDAVFCPVAPGVIVSTYHHENYADTFPGWQVLFVENQSWNAIPNWRKYKHANVDKWWIPDSDNNAEFTEFVDTWLSNWVGYVKETVFDVNMLQLDEHTVLVNNYNRELFDFLKQHKIEPVVTPFRHRFFWDGGIHCITADIYREGNQDVYITHK